MLWMNLDPDPPVESDFGAWFSATADGLLRRVTAAVGDPLLAQEATAEAFARAYERWPRVSRMDSPEGWVVRVAVNATRRSWRQRTLESRALARNLPILWSRDSGAPGEYHDDVYRAVLRLTQRQRTAVRLRYWDDLAEHEVAARMGVTTGTASSLLSSARARLRSALHDATPGGHR